MEDEKKYLAKTLKVLKNKQKALDEKINSLLNRYESLKREIGESLSEFKRGDDMSNAISEFEEKDEIIYTASQEGKRIELELKSPYFARIDFKPNSKAKASKIYIGIGNVIDDKKCYVVDWRAPISSMYYDFEIGNAQYHVNDKISDKVIKGEILLKRQYKIVDGELKAYFDTNLTISDDILKQILSQNVSTKMKQIVSSLQQEQNKIIRTDLNDNILIQGVAGSGKTSIALHRAAYLLYRHRNSIKSGDIIILSPNKIFSSYISEVLPQLGENNLCETTFEQIVRAELKRPLQSREDFLDKTIVSPTQKMLNEISYKSSYEYLDALLRFLKGAFIETYCPKDLVYVISDREEDEHKTITFSAEETKNLFFKTFKGLDFYERIRKIAWQYARVFTDMRGYNASQNSELSKRFERILFKFLPISDIEKIYQIFMARENLTASKGDEIKYLDKGTYLLIKHFLHGFDHDFSAKYLIIDEMQDFSPVDIYMFKKLWHCPRIIVGDINQCLEKTLPEEYLQITADFLGCNLSKLTKTYRSTKEIAQFANSLTICHDTEFVNRHGEMPKLISSLDQIAKIKEIIENECTQFEHIAIVCKNMKEADGIYKKLSKILPCTLLLEPDDYSSRVLITSCGGAKGIEFDAVIIPNANEENYNNAIDKNIIYVSATRALHKLFFISTTTPSKFLNNEFLQKE